MEVERIAQEMGELEEEVSTWRKGDVCMAEERKIDKKDVDEQVTFFHSLLSFLSFFFLLSFLVLFLLLLLLISPFSALKLFETVLLHNIGKLVDMSSCHSILRLASTCCSFHKLLSPVVSLVYPFAFPFISSTFYIS